MSDRHATPVIPPLQWERVCTFCWQELNPTEYQPDVDGELATCVVCLQYDRTYGMQTRAVVEAIAVTGHGSSRVTFEDLEEGSAEAVQRLINAHAWTLEGSVGRAMMAAIEDGACVLGLTSTRDFYGSYIPSRFEVKQGTKGSVAFMLATRKERDRS